MNRSFTTRGTTRRIGLGRKIVRAFGFGIGVGLSGPALFFGFGYHMIPGKTRTIVLVRPARPGLKLAQNQPNFFELIYSMNPMV